MDENLHLEKIKKAREKLVERLRVLAELNRQVPVLKMVLDELNWLYESEESAPKKTNSHVSESLLYNLSNLDDYLIKNALPIPKPFENPYFTVSTTSSSSDYEVHVLKLGETYSEDEDITTWAKNVSEKRRDLKNLQNRREIVSVRLAKLSSNLSEAHKKAVAATLTASSNIQSPAEAQRELLVQFKGELIRRSRNGAGKKYSRIADNLIYEAQELKSIVIDQQSLYDSLHAELSEIAKTRSVPGSGRLDATLVSLEDHVFIITTSLDPEKTGISFAS